MTETPGDSRPDYGSTPPPPPPPGGQGYPPPPPGGQGYPPPPPGGYEQPPAYQPPPAAPGGYEQPPAYQPPPAAPGGYEQPPAYQPPPAAPNQGGFAAGASNVGQQFQNFDPKSLQNFDPKSVNPLDWGIIAAGVLSLIPFSFFGYYHYSVKGFGEASLTWSAWHGFFGWFGILVAFLAALVLAAELIAKIKFPFPSRLVVLGGMALGLLCTLLAIFVIPDPGVSSSSINKGHGFSFWLILILMLVGTGLAFRRFTDTGGKLPSRGARP